MPWSNRQTRTSTAAHKQWAAEVKRRAGGQCQIRLPGCTGGADHADHVVPVAKGGAPYDPGNGEGACHLRCSHDHATQGRHPSPLVQFPRQKVLRLAVCTSLGSERCTLLSRQAWTGMVGRGSFSPGSVPVSVVEATCPRRHTRAGRGAGARTRAG